ncbi:MAG: PQQ-dependent dehydrogenase, methanol/ethanol family [Hyphomonadaceae bacterium]|nr:PQQ-dependent dehydrogenase, methanol/ethanol family [Hyphomonadaceae bacterium]
MAASCLVLSACSGSQDSDTSPSETSETPTETTAFAAVTDDRLNNAAATPAEWLGYGFDREETRHSPLTGISKNNISDLGVAWTYDLATSRGVESTPIVIDGVMYVTSAWSIVYALDAKTGEELWVYDPGVDRAVGVNACCDVVNRGVALYDGKVYVGVIDGRVEALDAETGDLVWSQVTVDQSKPYTITGAPRVVDGKVLIGNGGAELGVRGYLNALDAQTGELVWRFYTVPNPDMQPDGAASDSAFETVGNVTWGETGAWKTDGGGGTVWDSIIYDEENDTVIFGVGNGSPWNQSLRDPSGLDNLFLSSIVAVDADSGEYKWHFQTTPGDNWDYTATQTLIIATLPLGENGADRRVVMQAPKNGYFYVIDAATGEFISGNNYVPVNWATGLDENGRPIEVPEARYAEIPFLQTPGPLGGHNWHPMAYNPDVGLAYIPAQEIPQAYATDPRFQDNSTNWNTGADFAAGVPQLIPSEVFKFLRSGLKGRLIAWDPVAQEARWTVEHEGPWNGGVLSTASGIVFQGKLNGEFAAYDAATGEELWSADVKSGAASGPGTFEIEGEQYVTITTGWGSAYLLSAGGVAAPQPVPPAVGKVVTFKIGGTGEVPDIDVPLVEPTPKADEFGTEAQLAEGLIHYARNCTVCHGPFAVSAGVLPDLRWSAYTSSTDAWKGVLIDGNLQSIGMVSFADVLTEDEVEAIRAYVVQQAHNSEGIEDAIASEGGAP